jgi:hypothetical protein
MIHDDEEWETSVVQSDFTFESSVESLNRKAKTLNVGTGFEEQTRVSLTRKDRENHTHIIGSTGTGKSKAIEHFIRQDILDRKSGLCLIDPHGSLYDELVLWLSHNHPRLADRVILFDPAGETENIIGFNPIPNNNESIDYVLPMLMSACLKCWGQHDGGDRTPRISTWLENIFYVILAKRLTLLETLPFIDVSSPEGKKERERLLANIDNTAIINEWMKFEASSLTQKQTLIEGAANRLRKFLRSQIIRNILGQKERAINFYQLMTEGKVLLVNLNGRDKISFENTQLLGVMMVNDMFRCANLRDPRDPNLKPFYLYIDEFGQFITRDIAKALEECRKRKLFLTLAHQHLAQLKKEDEYLYASVMTNCKTKIVFGGLSVEDATVMDTEINTGFLDLKRIKDKMYSTKQRHIEETRTVRSNSRSSTQGRSKSQTDTESQSVADTQGESVSKGHSITNTEGEGETDSTGRGRGITHAQGSTEGHSTGRSDTTGEGSSHTTGKQHNQSKNWNHSDTYGQSDSHNESESQGHSHQRSSTTGTGKSYGETSNNSTSQSQNKSRTMVDQQERGSNTEGASSSQTNVSGKSYNRSEQKTEGLSEGQQYSKTTGRAHTNNQSHSDGYGGSTGTGTSESDTRSQTRAHSDSYTDNFSKSNSVAESEQENESHAVSKTRSRSQAEQQSETKNQSQTNTQGISHGVTRGTNEAITTGGSESVVPFHRVEEFKELSKREFWTKEELHYMSMSEIKNQETSHAFIKVGAKRPVKTKIDYVRATYYNARTSPKRIDEFRNKVFQSNPELYTPVEQAQQELEERQRLIFGEPLNYHPKEKQGQIIDVEPEPKKLIKSPLPDYDE